MRKVLEVKNITKTYKIYKNNFDRLKEIFLNKSLHKEFISNKDISFDLYEGETLGIIGVNGAGKSTILKIIAGVISPTSGEVVRHGRVTALLELGTGFNDELTGYENIFLNGMLIGMTQKECNQILDDVVAFSELERHINEPIKTYSSGMKMRLAFSIALFSEPQILIVDEALAVGDAHFSQKCINALKLRKEKNMSIIYVSHDLNSLKLLCDRLIMLNGGAVVQEGSPEGVINYYNYFIAKLDNFREERLCDGQVSPPSYGTLDIEIDKVVIQGDTSRTNSLEAGEKSYVVIQFHSNKTLQDISLGFLIRDRFGQDIFGTNTFYHQKTICTEAGKAYACKIEFSMNLGIGHYTLAVAIHKGESHLNQCFHWMDNAASFEVLSPRLERFIGVCKLDPKIDFSKDGVFYG